MTVNFACRVFDDAAMKQRLSPSVFESLQNTQKLGNPLDPSLAEAVASAMKDWAIEMGATHYTHWFQPMTNITAGKHEAFLNRTSSGEVIMEFSGKALIRGEPDASSFPTGGLRATFEARGYTAWDPTSPAFVRDGTLYIPTAFCSYNGEALDAKTPLLRSIQALSEQTMRILRLLGNTTSKSVVSMVGLEQEYFLVDREKYEQRLDLKICGRTLFGSKPPKGQELDDHYCGRIRLRVADFMRDLDERLWALGVLSKVKHNEVAPAQHELAPVFSSANIACDHNQLTMEVMRQVAKEHGLACLLHEKPFEYVNGSGKHDNWSINTDDGLNLLKAGKNPAENHQFLLFLCAVITAVDRYADLLRASAACRGNDDRLGMHEAPPAIISINLGNHLYSILKNIASGRRAVTDKAHYLAIGVDALPSLTQDDSDRNRTSPFAFTGNRFEFRMLGSSQSPAFSNVVLNAAVTEVLGEFEEMLTGVEDIPDTIRSIVAKTVAEHGRVIFNGNNYSDEWREEARKRGLPEINNTVDAIDVLIAPKNIELFAKTNIFTEDECYSRREILLENYAKVVFIEANTMYEMLTRQIIPAVTKYIGTVAHSYNELARVGIENAELKSMIAELSECESKLISGGRELDKLIAEGHTIENSREVCRFLTDTLNPYMRSLRAYADRAETLLDSASWPFPNYTDLLFRV
ncbi:MAG: glutamine synthetase III [Oscillospiraceae bacterium]|nr:glutamine synthetase III [Oscillospiraceae bacterium]MBQ3050163.1 glutamine synthetase III [Oscillospiraceae bacterium]